MILKCFKQFNVITVGERTPKLSNIGRGFIINSSHKFGALSRKRPQPKTMIGLAAMKKLTGLLSCHRRPGPSSRPRTGHRTFPQAPTGLHTRPRTQIGLRTSNLSRKMPARRATTIYPLFGRPTGKMKKKKTTGSGAPAPAAEKLRKRTSGTFNNIQTLAHYYNDFGRGA
jgi:hypothetical protein